MASSKQSSFSIHSRHSPSSAWFKGITINVSLVLGILVYTLNDPIHTTIDLVTLTFDQYLKIFILSKSSTKMVHFNTNTSFFGPKTLNKELQKI